MKYIIEKDIQNDSNKTAGSTISIGHEPDNNPKKYHELKKMIIE